MYTLRLYYCTIQNIQPSGERQDEEKTIIITKRIAIVLLWGLRWAFCSLSYLFRRRLFQYPVVVHLFIGRNIRSLGGPFRCVSIYSVGIEATMKEADRMTDD